MASRKAIQRDSTAATDGNGRTGRVLNSLFFIHENLLTLPILYLSRYIIQHKADYYRLLMDVTRAAAWEAWVKFMIAAVEETASWTTAKVEAIRELQSKTAAYVREAAPKAICGVHSYVAFRSEPSIASCSYGVEAT